MTNSKVWILTRAINDYNQDGEYFVAVFKEKPSREQLSAATGAKYDSEVVDNLLWNGGIRLGDEETWYYLSEVTAI